MQNGKETKSFAARVHDKKPAYFDGSDKRRAASINGKQAELVLHPKRESSDRVNFAGGKGQWLFVDNKELRDIVAAKSTAKLEFVTREGRAPKPAAEAAEKPAATAAAA